MTSAPPTQSESPPSFSPYDFSDLFGNNIYALKSVPIPALADTMKRNLESTLPLCDAKEASATTALWQEFENGVGAQLQDLLLAEEKIRSSSAAYPHHYFENHWDDMYNGSRDCAPINFSPFFGITNDKNPNNMDQCKRAGAFVSSFAKWSRVVLSGNLKPDTDPSAFQRMFGTAKIPTKGCDVLAQHQHESTNVVVLCNGHVFNVPVVDPTSGGVLNADACATLMRECVAQAATPADTSTCAQVMTTAPRDTWASVRAEMESNATNKAALSAIDKALIVVCLDTDYWQTLDDTANALLMGPCTNRWYDKHCLIVDTAGHMGICFEHSYSDGTGWGRFIRDVMMDVDGKAPLDVKTVDTPIAQPNELAWASSASLKSSIASAKSAYEKLIGGVACKALRCDAFGKDQCKTWKMGPDAVAQMVYQIVYRMMHGKMAATYEACATRKFFHGRTETIRTVTPEGKKLVEAVAAGGEVKAALEAAAAAHQGVSRAAASGLGCDRHLMALGKLAAKKGISAPALTDKITARSKDWLLSTSNGSQPYIDLFGFGPVTGEGYGIGYLVDKAQMSFCVTSFKGASSGTSASAFASNICSTMKWMKEMQEAVAKDGSEANVPALKLKGAKSKVNVASLLKPIALVVAGLAVLIPFLVRK